MTKLAQVLSPDGTAYAVAHHGLLGRMDFFLLSTDAPRKREGWSRPKPIPAPIYPVVQDVTLRLEDQDTMVLEFSWRDRGRTRPWAQGTVEFSPREVEKDSDQDGWTDVEEDRLALDPHDPDTDADGILDGTDPCPKFRQPANFLRAEETQILRRTTFAFFGFSGSRQLLLVPSSKKIQFIAYSGAVLYTDHAPAHDPELEPWESDTVAAGWKIKTKSESTAVVEVSVGTGMYGECYEAHLRKIDGQWYVIAAFLTCVS